MAANPRFPRSGDEDDWGPLDFPNYGGLGHVTTLGCPDPSNAKPVKKEPIGFLHFADPKPIKRRRARK
jgi:hypothetical protein